MIKIENCKIINCGTGIKSEGNIDLNIEGCNFKNNNRDIDLDITQNSKVNIKNVEFEGTKDESIRIKMLENKINKIEGLTEQEQEKLMEFLKEYKKEKSKDLIEKMYEELKKTLVSAPSQIALSLLINYITK